MHSSDLRLLISVNVRNAQKPIFALQGGFECPIVDEDTICRRREWLVRMLDVVRLEGGVALFENIIQLSLGHVAVAVLVYGADQAEHHG